MSASTDHTTPAAPFDLQSHSVHSDGALAPEAVVAAACEAGVKLLALTDHDTVGGVAEAAHAAASLTLRLVPAVEISAIGGAAGDLHVLGYMVDPGNEDLLSALARFAQIEIAGRGRSLRLSARLGSSSTGIRSRNASTRASR